MPLDGLRVGIIVAIVGRTTVFGGNDEAAPALGGGGKGRRPGDDREDRGKKKDSRPVGGRFVAEIGMMDHEFLASSDRTIARNALQRIYADTAAAEVAAFANVLRLDSPTVPSCSRGKDCRAPALHFRVDSEKQSRAAGCGAPTDGGTEP